jgi:hypothetical protein
MLLRSAFTLMLAGAIVGLWVPSEAQEIPGPRPPAPQGQNGMPLAAGAVDDPNENTPPMEPKSPLDEDGAEPLNLNRVPSDSSTSDHEAPSNSVVPPAPAAAPAPDLLRFEEDATAEPFIETMEVRREQAEDLPEEANVLALLPPPESLPALSIMPAFRLGPMTMAFGLRYGALYDNNIR